MANDDENRKRRDRRWTPGRMAFTAAIGLLWLAALGFAFSL